MIRSIPDLISELRNRRSDLAAASHNLLEQQSDLAEVIDAIDDTITFLIERSQQPPTPR